MVGLILYIAICTIVGFLGGMRRIGFWGGLFASLAFTPLIGFILVLALGPPYKKQPRR